MADSNLHVSPSGSVGKTQTQSPKTIKALGQAREALVRTAAGATILGLLSLAYVIALFKLGTAPHELLVMIGSGLGFLLGGRDRQQPGDS